MSYATIQHSTSPGTALRDSFTRTEAKGLLRRQNAEVADGLVSAIRVQSAAITAAVGIQCVGMLSREAQYQSAGDPAVANRVNHIVDQFACFVGNEVARFGI